MQFLLLCPKRDENGKLVCPYFTKETWVIIQTRLRSVRTLSWQYMSFVIFLPTHPTSKARHIGRSIYFDVHVVNVIHPVGISGHLWTWVLEWSALGRIWSPNVMDLQRRPGHRTLSYPRKARRHAVIHGYTGRMHPGHLLPPQPYTSG